MTLPAFPKPGQIKKKLEPIRYPDGPGGREICNLQTTEGRRIYFDRKKQAWLRQDKKCCLFGKLASFTQCVGQRRGGKIAFNECMFEHEAGRGGGKQDDRIERLNPETGKMEWINGAACAWCNSEKGSRRIKYNPEVLEAI